MDSNIATFGAGQSGLLVDYDTGGVSDRIELTVGDTASLNHSLGENAPRRTDAYQAFGGKVDCRGALCASGSGATLRLTFSGLDPSKLYECVFFANRGGTRYGHWKEDAFITLEEADSFRNESSPGTGYAGADDPRTLIMNGYNTIKGCIARFTRIRPGEDGAFSLHQVESNADVKEIYANAVMLREYTL